MARKRRKISLDLLLGSSVTPTTSRAGGLALGAYRAGVEASSDKRRAMFLQRAAEAGKIDTDDLGRKDMGLLKSAGLLAVTPDAQLSIRGTEDKSVGGFLENLFGEQGLYGALKGLPMGVYTAGKAIAQDWANPANIARGESQVYKDLIKPTVEQYQYMYGGKGAGGKDFFERFYEQPLGPILDAATVLSAGAGAVGKGAQAARSAGLAEGSTSARLARIPRVDTRPDITGDLGIGPQGERLEFPSIKRSYAPGALRKAFQIGADRAIQGTRFGDFSLGPLGTPRSLSINRALRSDAKRLQGLSELGGQARVYEAAKRMTPALKPLTDEESVALNFLRNGMTLQELPDGRTYLDAQVTNWEKSLTDTNPEGFNVRDFVDQARLPEPAARKYVQEQIERARDPEIRALIAQPTDQMKEAARAFEAERSQLLDDLGIDEAEDLKRAYLVQRDLARDDQGNAPNPQELADAFEEYANTTGAFDQIAPRDTPDAEPFRLRPSYTPQRPVRDMSLNRKGELKGEKRKPVSPLMTSLDQAFGAPRESYLEANELKAIKSGMVDTDPQVMLQFIGRVEHDLAERRKLTTEIDRYAVRDPETNEPAVFKDEAEMRRELGTSSDWVFMPEDAVDVKFYRQQLDLGKEVMEVIDEIRAQGDDALLNVDDFLQERLGTVIDENSKQFVRELLGARKNKGYALPRSYVDYRLKLAKVRDPFGNKFLDGWVAMRNKWAALTLAYMPRWYVNTVMGSMMLAAIKGTMNPGDYLRSWRMMSRGAVPPELGMGVVASEMLEGGRSGVLTATLPTRKLFEGATRIENFFRRAMFVQSLRKFEKERMQDLGEEFVNFNPIHEAAMDLSGGKPEGYLQAMDQAVDTMMGYDRSTGRFDPSREKLIDMAVSEANRFSYNYLVMGPAERRYVRNFGVPFWGWYKFITTLAWRLPVDHPGRTNILATLGEIGQEAEEDILGTSVPPWIKGSILLNKDPGNLKYLPAFGFNPFAQIANPFDESRGAVAGLLGMGQLAPPWQAALRAAGIDPFTGGRVAVAPESGVSLDFFGQPVDVARGTPLDSLAQVKPLERGIYSLLRSVPQVQIVEQTATQGRPVYPESPPWAPNPMLTKNPRDTSGGGTLLRLLGAAARQYDVEGWQALQKERIEYARTRNRNELRKRRRGLNQVYGVPGQ